MEIYTWLYFFAFLSVPFSTLADDVAQVSCTPHYKKMGCFKEATMQEAEMKLIINDRDKKGIDLNWNEFAKSIHSLVCRCSAKAQKEGYTYFSIRFWAECWAGKNITELYAILANPSKKSIHCSNYKFEMCDDDAEGECVGKASHDYFYKLALWTNLGAWSKCTKPCGGGTRQPIKECNIEGKCEGNAIETESCNIDACPVCRWVDNQSIIGTSDLLVKDIQSKDECFTACLWKYVEDPEIDAINFRKNEEVKCQCMRGGTHSTGNAANTYCKFALSFFG